LFRLIRLTRRRRKKSVVSRSPRPMLSMRRTPSLCACGLPGPCGLYQEHDHRCGPDGRRDSGGGVPMTVRCPRPASTFCWPVRWVYPHRGISEQMRHGGRRRADRAGGAGASGACWTNMSFPETTLRSSGQRPEGPGVMMRTVRMPSRFSSFWMPSTVTFPSRSGMWTSRF
jgi:hypothetical protein